MPLTIEQQVKELIERAEREGRKDVKPSRAVHNRSSLHKIIKTKEQAAAFMKSLKAAEQDS